MAASVPELIEGIGASDAHRIKEAVSIPVFLHRRLADGFAHRRCDPGRRLRRCVTSRVRFWPTPICPGCFLAGEDGPAPGKECTYCNKCLVNVIELPIGCFEESRFAEYGEAAYDRMIEEAMSYYRDEVPAGAELRREKAGAALTTRTGQAAWATKAVAG